MRRRDFIILLGIAANFPRDAAAQQTDRVRRIAVLISLAESDLESRQRVAALREGLQELGWVEGQNLRIAWRFAAGDVGTAHDYATELVRSAPDVILANGTPVLAAVQRATRSIPIVFAIVNDPVAQGFIASLAHPGNNTTGFTSVEYSMIGKWLDALREVALGVARLGLLFNPDSTPYYETFLQSWAATRTTPSVEIQAARARASADIEPIIARLGAEPGGGIIVPPDPFTLANRDLIMRSAAQHRVPAIYAYRLFVGEGGLMSYGPDTADIFRRSASYVDRILKGAAAGELPAQSPVKFDLAINLKTAKSLGLTVPPNLLALADEVIE